MSNYKNSQKNQLLSFNNIRYSNVSNRKAGVLSKYSQGTIYQNMAVQDFTIGLPLSLLLSSVETHVEKKTSVGFVLTST